MLVDGSPLRTDTRKAVALLAYLSQRDTAPDREQLVELLWSESTPERGRGALRRTLSTLRAALGGHWVVADRQRIALDRHDVVVDTDLLADGATSVADLVRGRFLEGFWLHDAPAFDAWQAATAEQCDRLIQRRLGEEVERAIQHGDARCTDLAERLVDLDQLDESAHCLLMRAHAALGDRAAVTRQFRRLVAVLDGELAVEPLPETVALHEAIMAGGVGTVPAATRPEQAAHEQAAHERAAHEHAAQVLGLAPVERQVAEALAVLGTTDLATLAAVAGRATDETAEVIDLLAARGLASVAAAHPTAIEPCAVLVTDVLERVGPARRIVLNTRAADVLERDELPGSAAARATHLELAGLRARASRARWDAAVEAAAATDHDATRVHLRAALALGHPDARALHRWLGDIERATGRYGAAVAAYHTAGAYGTDASLERAIGDVYRRWGRWGLAQASFEAAEALAGPTELPLVLADRAEVALRSGDGRAATELVTAALAAGGDMVAAVRNVAGLVLGDVEHLSAAVALARKEGAPAAEAAALNNLALAHLHAGDGRLALESASRALALLDRSEDRHRRAALHGNLADIHHALGAEEPSREHLRLAAALFAEVGIEPGEWDPAIWSLTSW